MKTRKVVVGIVYKKQSHMIDFLILHRVWIWWGWEFPKGGIEKGEIEEEALRREIMEETGLTKIRIIDKLPYEISYKYPKKYSENFKYTGTTQSVFLVRAFDEVRLPEKGEKEHDSFLWLPYRDARKRLTHSNYKKALDIAWKQMQGNA